MNACISKFLRFWVFVCDMWCISSGQYHLFSSFERENSVPYLIIYPLFISQRKQCTLPYYLSIVHFTEKTVYPTLLFVHCSFHRESSVPYLIIYPVFILKRKQCTLPYYLFIVHFKEKAVYPTLLFIQFSFERENSVPYLIICPLFISQRK